MTCPKCGSRIPLDLMRCLACEYDALPQDIAHSSQTKVAPGQSARAAAELMFKESAYRGLPSPVELAEMVRRAKRALWLILAVLGVMAAVALLLFSLRR